MSDDYHIDEHGNGWVPQMRLQAEKQKVRELEAENAKLRDSVAELTAESNGYFKALVAVQALVAAAQEAGGG